MRKFIYLFMFLFACTSYAQTEQISGQFRLIGTQEQPEADKVLTIDDNGDVGYMNSNRPSFARYRMQPIPSSFNDIVSFNSTPIKENAKTELQSSGTMISVLEGGFFLVSISLNGLSSSDNLDLKVTLNKSGVEELIDRQTLTARALYMDLGIIELNVGDYLYLNSNGVTGSGANTFIDLSIQKIK